MSAPSTETLEATDRAISVAMVDAGSFSPQYDYALCNSLVRSGCELMLAHSDIPYAPWPIPAEFVSWNQFYPTSRWLRVHGWPRMAKLSKGMEHAMGMGRLAAKLQKARPDIIHFQWMPLPLVDRGYLPRLARIAPLVFTMHNTVPYHGNPPSTFSVAGLSANLKYFDAIVVHTEFSKQRLIAQGYPEPEKIHVIPHAAFEHYRNMGECRRFSDGQLVLFVGSIRPYKGVDILLRAFAQLSPAIRLKTQLLIAGRPASALRAMRNLAVSLNIEKRVIWNDGMLSEEDVASLYRSATVVALPYRDVDGSAALMSALALEKPVVATRIGGIPEIIQDGVHGLLVDPDNPAMFAAALESVLADPPLRSKMEAALAKLRTGTLSWKHSAKLTINMYRGLLATRSAETNTVHSV